MLADPQWRGEHNVTPGGVIPTCGKAERLKAHARRCIYVPKSDVEHVLALTLRQGNEDGPLPRMSHPDVQSSSRPLKRAKKSHSSFDTTSSVAEDTSEPSAGGTWDSARQNELAIDICKLFAVCGWAWNSVENPEVDLFFAKWVPGSAVPDRRKLSGPCLDAAAATAESRIAARVRGKVATGQCDGWKNVAKTNVVTSMMTVERAVSEHSLESAARNLMCSNL